MSATHGSSGPSPITESPWFWLYLFATAGLVALLLAGPRYVARQVQLERNLQGRQRAAQVRSGEIPYTPLTPEGRPQIRLTPLYAVLIIFVAIGWGGLWWSRWRRPAPPSVPPKSSVPPPPCDAQRTPVSDSGAVPSGSS